MTLAFTLFFASLVGLALLFTIKSIETRRQRVFMPHLRESADDAALSLKVLLDRARVESARIPPTLMYVTRFLLHEAALGVAKLARIAEAKSHSVADYVSHKRGFEKREPRSEFLKHMNDHKDGRSL